MSTGKPKKKEVAVKLNMTFEEAMKKALNTPLPPKKVSLSQKNNKKK
jgi:hypothetical protein